ncbi:MAG: hypothetical protein N2Z70_04365 [Bdellovibrionaceae bacterium]|nr:hypothetical protein [Pseudobdellovibrionaceae bacterium]
MRSSRNDKLELKVLTGILTLSVGLIFESCSMKKDVAPSPPPPKPYLYVASGNCYAGGVTTIAGSGLVARFDKSTGAFDKIMVDYNQFSNGDMPVGLVDGGDHLYIVVENTSGRRIDRLDKQSGQIQTWITHATALNAQIRSAALALDGSLLVSKSSAIEKFSPNKSRVTVGTNPYINAPGSSCATSTTLISAVRVLPNGSIIYTHAGASPNNKIGVISETGYVTTANCLSSHNHTVATGMPTALAYHPSGKFLVSYASTTLTSNAIYSYDINLTTHAISGATVAYSNTAFVNGSSAMTVDPLTGKVYVANAGASMYNVYKMSFDTTAGTLSLDSTQPFLPASVFTRCVSDLLIAD